MRGLGLRLVFKLLHGNAVLRGSHEILRKGLLEDLRARLDALVADERVARTLDQLANLVLGLPAEGAANDVAAVHI